MQIDHTDTFDASVSITLQMLPNISWLIFAKFTEHTQNQPWHLWPAPVSDTKWQTRSPPSKLTIPWAPGALSRWNQRKKSCHPSQAILSSLPLANLNSPSPQLREKLPLKVCTLIFSIKRTQQTQKMLTTNSLHYIHLVNSFFLLFLPRTPINKFNHIERSTWISWWYFLD